MEKTEKQIREEKILEAIEQMYVDIRDFFKYLITVAVTIIPLIIGISGFLLKDKELNGYALGFLITGLFFIFVTIPVNLANYKPIYKPWSNESYDLVHDITTDKKTIATISIILLVVGMLIAFIGILLVILI